MKLTEQQLAQIFRQNMDTVIESDNIDLSNTLDASEKRLKEVELIANNSTLSASHQIINNLNDWSQTISIELQNQIKPTLFNKIITWMQPILASAAVIIAVFFVTPLNHQKNQSNPLFITQQTDLKSQKPDRIMYSSSFENDNNNVNQNNRKNNTDVIAKFDFS